MAPSRDVVLYHYTYSPYARRIVWYLQLRQIPYSECMQPPMLPRPDIKTLGINYRRIPILSIGRDIYHDTRLIISKLNAFFPPSAEHPGLAPTTAEHIALSTLMSNWVNDGGVFVRASQLIPSSLPLLKDPKFIKDRSALTGRSWSKEALDRAKPEALTEIRAAFTFLETGLLADGREWLLNTDRPSQVDLEAVWPIHWVLSMPGAIPDSVASAKTHPRVFAWVERFSAAVAQAKKSVQVQKIKGDFAADKAWSSEYAEESDSGVQEGDTSGLTVGTEVLVHPTDSGVLHKDRGSLVALSEREIVIEVSSGKGKSVRVHTPRHGFRVVRAVDGAKI